MLSPCRYRIYDPDTASNTHMQDHIYNSTSASAGPTTTIPSSASILTALTFITFKDLKLAHYRISAESREAGGSSVRTRRCPRRPLRRRYRSYPGPETCIAEGPHAVDVL
jgi:hypothetical protein